MERINAETIAGIALVLLALIFIFAATMNQVWAIILPADYLILALGFAFIALGVYTTRNNRRKQHSPEESTHH
jgi:putative Ca2+/H+ antiporter (TMEM165/GDT1 family)